MASAVSATSNITDEERRWAVVGVCINKVLTPQLRNILKKEIQIWYNQLCNPPHDIDKQVLATYKKKLLPSTFLLKYENINNNHVHKSIKAYDFQVKDPLSLAKLFVQPFMAKFTAFDETMDMSAVLAIMCEADPFITSGAAVDAWTIRSNIRNKWAHCNFSDWTEPAFKDAFRDMNSLVKKMNLPPADEQALCDDLDSWKEKGLQLCFGEPVDPELLKLVTENVAELRLSVKNLEFESDAQMKTFLEKLGKLQSNFENRLIDLLGRIERCEERGAENTKEIKLLDKKFNTELTKFYSKEEEKVPYVFDAPDRNQYFSGRSQELQDLQRILNLENTGLGKTVCLAAVCGLGGVGKTTLVTEYAHRMKKYYQGGVYWFSAEDDTFFQQSVNDAGLKLGALLATFDLTLTNTVIKIGQTSKPCLIVLDCLDQLDISANISKFLFLLLKHCVSAAVVLLTRRSETKLVDEISNLRKDRCLSLTCLQEEEAKQFIFYRTELTPDDSTNIVAESLVKELGGLPLALEQAGACIKALRCTLSDYLEQFQTERLKLLESQKAKQVSVYEKPERLAVHTTWLLNIKHIKESQHGMSAIRLMNAFAFLNPSGIEDDLVNVGERPIEDKAFRDCVSSPLGSRQVVKLLTDFSLFMYVHAHSVSTHRLVQELVRESLDAEGKGKSFVDAVRFLSFAFSKCSSPEHLLGNVGMQERLKAYDLLRNHSKYYLWSKLCFHGFQLQKNMEKLLANPDPECLDSVFVFETAKLLYQCAVYLSANQKQEEAKQTLNFSYRLLDWIPVEEYDTIEKGLSSNSFFLCHVIPLPKWLQIVIKKCCVPPMISLEPLEGKSKIVTHEESLKQNIEKLKLEGNKNFKDGLYKEAVASYSAAIDKSRNTPVFNALLLTNRASAYIEQKQFDDALRDANEYISQFPDCWKVYARKALALNDKISREITAALAYYYFFLKDGRCIFSEYKPFTEAFPSLKERISICNTADQLMAVLRSNILRQDCLGIIILGSKVYKLNLFIRPCDVKNCIMVGTKSDASVTLKLESFSMLRLFEKCMFANISFALDQGQISGCDGSFVKMLNCNFTSDNDVSAAVAATGYYLIKAIKSVSKAQF